jgi:hypothetical protein
VHGVLMATAHAMIPSDGPAQRNSIAGDVDNNPDSPLESGIVRVRAGRFGGLANTMLLHNGMLIWRHIILPFVAC